jgi:hypothetical protein
LHALSIQRIGEWGEYPGYPENKDKPALLVLAGGEAGRLRWPSVLEDKYTKIINNYIETS